MANPDAPSPQRLLRELRQWRHAYNDFRRHLAGTLGPAPGATPRREVFRLDKLRLFRYGTGSGIPLLIVFALVNRPDVLDLRAERSLVGALIARGIDVYLIDWGDPDDADCDLDLATYILDYLAACVDRVRRLSGAPRIDLLGVCQGGVLALCYTALHGDTVRRLITMVTPVDFHTPDNQLSNLLREVDAGLLTRTFGNVPGGLITAAFLALKPLSLGAKKYLDAAGTSADAASLEVFRRMEWWIHDAPDLAGTAFCEFVELFFQRNSLVRGGLRLRGRMVDPARICQPVLNIYATRDHLVPAAAARGLGPLLTQAAYSELAVEAGHIGIYVSRAAAQEVPRRIGNWLAA